MYSAYKLNKQGDNIQPCGTPFPIWNHAKTGTIKDRNGIDLTEAEDIKRWQEYTENYMKKIFTAQIITMM